MVYPAGSRAFRGPRVSPTSDLSRAANERDASVDASADERDGLLVNVPVFDAALDRADHLVGSE